MSGADYFDVAADINPFMHGHKTAERSRAQAEFSAIRAAIEQAGIKVIKTDPPAGCQDGIFTANWGICRGDTVVLSSLPPQRQDEQPHAAEVLHKLGKRTVKAPYRFSGQGDALPCGNLLFAGGGYRTDPRMHEFLAGELGFEVISLHAVPELDDAGRPVTNRLTGWPDSYFYDLDLAVCILRPDLIAWCPEAFTPESQDKIRSLTQLQKIEVSRREAVEGFACNSVSTGSVVIMSPRAPEFKAAVEKHGLTVATVNAPELYKGGGGIRCSTLTLDNA